MSGVDNLDIEVAGNRNLNGSRIACLGAGYVGGPTMVTIAERCPHIEVHVVDISQPRIDAWNSDKLPIFEPGLHDAVMKTRGKNLFFSTDIAGVVKMCDIIFVSVNTPTKRQGVGKGRAANLTAWESAGRSIAMYSDTTKIVVEKSTVPVRTAAALQRVLEANKAPNVEFIILSNPEFLAEGTAMDDLANPDRILVGGPQNKAGKEAIETLVDIYANWVPRERILATNLWSSELSKLVANAFLAQRVSSINSISQLCEYTGADVTEVAHAIGRDSRIGSKFLTASVGFGGSCFQKDILNLVYICQNLGLREVADYWEQVIMINDLQKRHFTQRILSSMFNTVSGKKIAVFGFAFKKNTGDTRETPALDVCNMLLQEMARLYVYDPKVEREQALREFADHDITDVDFGKLFVTATSPREAICDAHAIVILTDWDEFRDYDYEEFYSLMKKPAFIFDGRNILDHAKMSAIGFEVHSIGKGSSERDLYNQK